MAVNGEVYREFFEKVERVLRVIANSIEEAPQALKTDVLKLADQAADFSTKDRPLALDLAALEEALR